MIYLKNLNNDYMKFKIYATSIIAAIILYSNRGFGENNPTVQFLSYKSSGLRLSGDLVLLVEDIVKNKWNGIEFLNAENGISYSRGGEYLLTKKNIQPQHLQSGLLKSTEQKNLHYFESNRAFLVISDQAPIEFVEQIKKYKNKHTLFEDRHVYWNDLDWGQVKSGLTTNEGFSVYSFNKSNWLSSTNWNFSAYFTYRLKLNNQIFEVTVLPKQFGGVTRVMSAIKKHEKKGAIVLGLGDITPPVEGASRGDLEILDVLNMGTDNPQYILASGDEILGYHKYKEYYKTQVEKSKVHLISSNVFFDEAGQKTLAFTPYKIINIKSKKVALIGITAPRFNNTIEKFTARLPWLKSVSIMEPRLILENDIIPKIRKQVDLIVVFTNMTSAERAQYSDDIEGIDILIHGADTTFGYEKILTVDLKNYDLRSPRIPILDLEASDLHLNETNFEFIERDIHLKNQIHYLDQKYDLTDFGASFSESFSNMIAAQDIALPDHRFIYDDKIMVSKEEFANTAAEIMRRKLRAEVGIFNIQAQQSTLPGRVDSAVIKTWIRTHEHLVSGYLKGSDLALLLDQNVLVEKNFKLAFAGLDKSKTIHGSPINSNEYYRIATSSAISENLSKYPSFKSFDKKSFHFTNQDNFYEEDMSGNQVVLAEMVSASLVDIWKQKEQLPEAERYQFYRQLYEGFFLDNEDLGYWAHDFKNFRIEYSQLKTTDTFEFDQVRDSRLNMADQKIFTGRLDFSAYYRRNPLLSEVGIKAQYSKLELSSANDVKNSYILGDDLVVFANLGLPVFEVQSADWFATNSGPIAELAYDSEFESDANLPYQKNIQSFMGWKFYNGSMFRSTLVSLFNENRLSDSIKKNQWGATVRFEIDQLLLSDTSNFKSQLDYKYYFDSDDDNQEDLRSRLIWDNYLDLKLTKNFSFGPFVKLGSFTGKVFNKTASQTTIGFNFNFSSFWKPKYQKDPL